MTQDPDFQVLVTADEAWPALERRVLAARSEVITSFRIFDLSTRLRSREAQAIGDTWADLIEHVLLNGVCVHLIVADFDAIMGTQLHQIAWQTKAQADDLKRKLGSKANLKVTMALHPARAGHLPKLALMPWILKRRAKSLHKHRSPAQTPGLQGSGLPDVTPATHHQKLAVIDSEWVYIGGLDINERRYDTPAHDLPAHQTWSDVQLLVRGPEAGDARLHLTSFLDVVRGKRSLPDTGALRRTLSGPRRLQLPFLSPRTLAHEIEQDHLRAFSTAQHLIYVETQFMRSDPIAEGLAAAARANPQLSLIMIIPSAPDDVLFENNTGIDAKFGMALQSDKVGKILDAFGSRATLASPVKPVMAARDVPEVLCGSEVIYVHNKILIVDGKFAHVGSANLNGRSMRWDSEASLRITDKDRVAILQERLHRHWWFDPLPEIACDPVHMRSWWHSQIAKNAVLRPENRFGFLVPHQPDITRGLEQALPGVTENLV